MEVVKRQYASFFYLLFFMSYNNIMLNIQIEKMQKFHIPSIMEIEAVSFGKYHWSENSFEAELKNNLAHYYVAKHNEQLVAYCGFWNIFEEAHITTFAVKNEFRKQKIAEQLMLHIFEKAKEFGIKWFTLEVRASNLPAINLYKKYGFESIGVREKYYQDNNEDALIMWTQSIYSDRFKTLINDLKLQLER